MQFYLQAGRETTMQFVVALVGHLKKKNNFSGAIFMSMAYVCHAHFCMQYYITYIPHRVSLFLLVIVWHLVPCSEQTPCILLNLAF